MSEEMVTGGWKGTAISPPAFFALAARIFGVDASTLTPATAYGSIPGWDSVNHLRLVMETEKAFGVRYPLERIPSLLTLADFLDVRATRAEI